MAEIHDSDEGPIVSATIGNLTELRKQLFDEIMANTVEGDDCASCIAYRHSARIVMGHDKAVPPMMIDKEIPPLYPPTKGKKKREKGKG